MTDATGHKFWCGAARNDKCKARLPRRAPAPNRSLPIKRYPSRPQQVKRAPTLILRALHLSPSPLRLLQGSRQARPSTFRATVTMLLRSTVFLRLPVTAAFIPSLQAWMRLKRAHLHSCFSTFNHRVSDDDDHGMNCNLSIQLYRSRPAFRAVGKDCDGHGALDNLEACGNGALVSTQGWCTVVRVVVRGIPLATCLDVRRRLHRHCPMMGRLR